MKKCLLIFLSLFSLSFYSTSAAYRPEFQVQPGEWSPIGPEGGNIESMSFHPQNKSEVYALTYTMPAQVFRSSNSGQSWERISSLNSYCYSIAISPSNPSTIYALSSSGVFKSIDSGSTWTEYKFGNYCYGQGEIVINSSTPSIIFAGGYYYDFGTGKYYIAVYKSTDGGSSWARKTMGAASSSAYVQSLAISASNPDVIYASGYSYLNNIAYYKIYKSIDAGESWNDVSGNIPGITYDLQVDPGNPSKVYAGTTWGVYRSSDGGQTWTKNNGIVYAYALAIDSNNSNILYAGYLKRSFKSIDGGVNWTEYSSGLVGQCNSLITSPSLVFYGSTAGIYKSSDSGASWQASHSGVKACQIPSLALAPSSPNIIYAEVAGNGYFKSLNFGESWQRLPDFYRCESITKTVVHPQNANTVFILAGG